MMTIEDWLSHHGHYAQATRRVYDTDGSYAKRGDVGEVCDIDCADRYVIVNFPATGPVLCLPNEIRPA